MRNVIFAALISLCTGCVDGHGHPTQEQLAPPIAECGLQPQRTDYPTLELWADDAAQWMTCARFTCNEIVVDTGK